MLFSGCQPHPHSSAACTRWRWRWSSRSYQYQRCWRSKWAEGGRDENGLSMFWFESVQLIKLMPDSPHWGNPKIGRRQTVGVYSTESRPLINIHPLIKKILLYLQWTMIGPAEDGASSLALSTSCTSSRRGGALSGVFWSGHEVYQYWRRLRSSSPHYHIQTHYTQMRNTGNQANSVTYGKV